MADTLVPMKVDVLTPDALVYSDEGVDMVIARALDGDFAVMKNHLPLAAALQVCQVRIQKGGKEKKIAVFGGFLEMKDNYVNIITPQAETAENIDIPRAEAAMSRARNRLAHVTPDIDVDRAKAALQRALVRIQVSGKN